MPNLTLLPWGHLRGSLGPGFDIGLGWSVHQKIFTTAKLKFLVPLSRHRDKRSYGPDVALVIWGLPGRPQMTLKHFPWVYYYH